jgi:hypothetical protein
MSTAIFSTAVAVAALSLVGAGRAHARDAVDGRWFADRPVAWHEHDDEDVPRPPAPTHLQDLDRSLLLRDSIANEVDRFLGLEAGRPAEDVNALDEVPCSTWFCPRNHRQPLDAAAIAAGPAAAPPRLPLRIVKGKDQGATPGFQVRDADGRKFVLKFDPVGHPGLSTGAEMVGERLFHAAGYNVAGAFLLDLTPSDLRLDEKATFKLHGVQLRPLTAARVRLLLDRAARLSDGRYRAVAVPWIPGQILGGYDTLGRRADDPNDRIPHERRRSLRASWVLFAWLSEVDPGSINSLDSYVEEGGRRFVRHYVLDFGATLGSETIRPKALQRTGEHIIEVGRTLLAFVSLGFYRRPFQDYRAEWERSVGQYPAAGWFPAETFDPDGFRSNRKIPAHVRKTDRDLYWGAKLVTSFSDEQLAAVLATAGLPASDTAHLEHALRVRRDIIGRRYLRAIAAVENPETAADGRAVCFDDLVLERRYAALDEVRYLVEVTDGHGNRLSSEERVPTGNRTCLSTGAAGSAGAYRIVEVKTRFDAAGKPPVTSKAARIHLRWRDGEQRFVVVGLERDE